MQNVPFSPNLYTTAWHLLCNDLHDLRLKCKLAFPSAADFAGDGSTKTKISKLIPNSLPLRQFYLPDNVEKRFIHPTSTPPHASFT
jgi:hypothetical protein